MGQPDRERSARELEIIEKVREFCADLPEVETIIDGFGHTTFRVRKKSFVLIGASDDDKGSLSIKSDPSTQQALIKRGYVRTPYIGQHGWVTAWGKDKLKWKEIRSLVRDAYRLAAPKKLAQSVADD